MAHTQLDYIKAHLRSGKTLSALEALGLYRAFRLAARIKELRDQHWDITTTMRLDITGKSYAVYSLELPKSLLPPRYQGSAVRANS